MLGIYVEDNLPEEAAWKQIKHLQDIKKPKEVNEWVRYIRNINTLLPLMGGQKLDVEELVENVITPNIPDPWIKPFKLVGANQ